jgi:hypothetical protein
MSGAHVRSCASRPPEVTVSAEFPLRPLTLGEVLDAGAAVLRRRPAILLLAVLFAGAERFALRAAWTSLDPHVHSIGAFFDHLGAYWKMISVGMGTEAFIFGLLGAFTAPVAVRLVTAEAGRVTVTLRRRWLSVIVTSAGVGAIATATFYLGGVPWLAWFMLSALAIPALVVDGAVPGRNGRLRNPVAVFGRSVKLASRGLLAGRVRLLGYLPWVLLRLLLFAFGGGEAVAGLLSITSDRAVTVIDWMLWITLNALCYTTVAGIDAAALLETRIRTEGLDIAVGRAARTGRPVEPVLGVPR